jgi:hypothetical protein
MLGLSWLKDVVVYTTTTGFSWGLFLGLFLVGILFYVLVAWLLYRIGKKLGYQKSWYAWVPFLNYWMMVELSTRESSWFWIIFITMFIPCINIVGLVMLVIVMMDISEACGKESWWGILWIIPIVNFVIMYMLGSGPAVPPQGPQPPPTYTPPPPPQQ